MRSPRIFVRILLLGLLLGTSSTAYADTISITSVSLSNLQFVPTSGNIVFVTTQFAPRATASGAAVINMPGFDQELGNSMQSPTHAEASTSVPFATAGGVADVTTLSLSANTNVMLSDCVCQAETEGLASIRLSFMITGGTGNVNLNFSGLLATVQNLVIDESSLFAASGVRVNVRVFHPDCADVFNPSCGNVNQTFSFDSRIVLRPPDISTSLEIQRQISDVVTLQFDQQYNILISIDATSRAAQSEIPEPASVVLLVSGLGFMAGVVKKRLRRVG
ncbi:MAG TPA: PEP-CTERM sorting domain-containing protein [Pyrinomonadaceae bacterium]|nr:PEP-CTERM sorting domain-containing protein [Pyrinomonadaceae bacterium]